ncbi:MAG: peptide ABC transporter substrate-binding protein [Verrucomicrobia bacterium]|nr:peptide ABC transporter substrate-binding protein [Verrucomicrobiota bacterium]
MKFFSCLLLCLLLAGCEASFQRADLVFLNGAEPETLDPALITGQPEGRIADALFEGLTTFDAAAKPVPGVAQWWEISPDSRVYTFHLRPDARWSNGERVTADDFVRSWRRVLDPVTGSEYASQLYTVRNGRAFNEGKLRDFAQVGVRALDPCTLEVTLENPTPYFLDLCALVTLLPVHAASLERFPDDWTKPGKLIGNGAYLLADWRINDRIRLAKNSHYWNREKVALRTIDVLPISKANTAFNFYASGQADLLMDKGLVPNQLLDELKKRLDFHAAPFLGVYFLRFNCTRPPFNDPRVRRAFGLVIEKRLLVDKITRAGEKPADSLTPPGTGGYEPPHGPARDPDQARALLAQAGYPGGKGFPRVGYLYSEGELNEALAVELQAMFQRELGVSLDLQRQEWKVYLRSMSSLDYDLCRASWVGDYNDPNTFLGCFVTNDGNNRTGWSNPQYDALLAAAAREPDRRFELFRQAEHLLVSEQAPICPLYYYVGIQFYDGTRLGGIQANLLDEHPLKSIFWKPR